MLVLALHCRLSLLPLITNRKLSMLTSTSVICVSLRCCARLSSADTDNVTWIVLNASDPLFADATVRMSQEMLP